MAGGGLRLENLAEVVCRSGVTMLHSSLTRSNGSGPHRDGDGPASAPPQSQLLESDVREAIRLFREAYEARAAAASSIE
jgi:copper homeostasis protein CutC